MIKYFFIGTFICLSPAFFSCKEKPEPRYIGFSQCSNDEWRSKMNVEMQHEAVLYPDIHLEIRTVTDDTEKQINDIRYFIDNNADLIIVAPNKTEPLTPVVEKAYNKGIPVILVDRKISSDKYTAFIGADNYQIGKDVGNYIAKLLDGKGFVFEIHGLEGSSPATERHNGFIDVIKDYPSINLLPSVDGAWLKDVAENKMDYALTAYPRINAVYAHNDRMALGAYSAALRHNRADSILFFGIDAIPGEDGGINQVLNKKLKATFIYPTNGEKIIQLAVNILAGNPYEKHNTLYSNVVDNTNARLLKLQTDAIIERENKIAILNSKINNYFTQYITQRYLLLAVIIITFIISILFLLISKAYRSKQRLNVKLGKRNDEINQQKKLLETQRDQLIELSKKLEQATHAKLVFFTNISHEFKTPLTLISGPVNTLLADKSISFESRRLLSLAKKNIVILLELIDQILDFRKYENGKMTLSLSVNDLHDQLVEINESFVELSKQKNCNFEFIATAGNFQMLYDYKKMERIYFNLLSNAFKFTPAKGLVSVALIKIENEKGVFAVFKVSNSGTGISKSNIQNLFNRFYQVDSRFAGSGIGLALSKSLIELHGGEISVDSNEMTSITTFTVVIPFTSELKENADASSSCPAEISVSGLDKTSVASNEQEIIYDSIFDNEIDKNKGLLLVIDDNPDIRLFIKSVVNEEFSVIEAKDGSEGFRKAVKYIPDLIVSDVMMPPPDGVELCRQLKNELLTNHIPVILLTAYSLDEQRITGFEGGADDFIAKPFNSDVLLVRIKNLIDNRKKLKSAFQKGFMESENKLMLNNSDKSFIEKFKLLIEKEIDNTQLNIEDIGQELGLSRTQLFRKVKSITGYAPVELLKIIRLKRAYTLLSTTERSVSEVAYDTGFSSPSYFAKCFREQYHKSPADFLKSVRQSH
ncbi:MAG: substrate-binding domain-containing protein [Tannerellaceae bacterium]|jgi:ABC-type sugar transport system substrate-binding protein/DNA-binding response OmpR family regulator/nitrogen-specific signal transduction histidine kinase|nr:substrate-binding domain-containing protein [Tannerellaceae bacterium]